MPAPPTVGDHIVTSLKQGIPLEGTFNPKTDKTAWRQGKNKIHGRAVTKLIEQGRIKVESMPFPFTNGRRAHLTYAGDDMPQLSLRKPLASRFDVIVPFVDNKTVRKPIVVRVMNEFDTKQEDFEVVDIRPAEEGELLVELDDYCVVRAAIRHNGLCVIVKPIGRDL